MTDHPLQNLDQIEIVGKRHDGGIDLVIVVSAPLVACELHKRLLRAKVEAYAREVRTQQFREEVGLHESGGIRILIVSDHFVDAAMRDFVESLEPIAGEVGLTLQLKSSAQHWGRRE
jgi:hypothetical protein